MSDSQETRPEERLRRIEQEADYLEHEMDQTREAVRRAQRADSMGQPGLEESVSEAQPQPEGVRRPASPEQPEEDA